MLHNIDMFITKTSHLLFRVRVRLVTLLKCLQTDGARRHRSQGCLQVRLDIPTIDL